MVLDDYIDYEKMFFDLLEKQKSEQEDSKLSKKLLNFYYDYKYPLTSTNLICDRNLTKRYSHMVVIYFIDNSSIEREYKITFNYVEETFIGCIYTFK